MFKLRWQDYFQSTPTEKELSEDELWKELKSLDGYVWSVFCQGIGGMGFQDSVALEIECPDGRILYPQFLGDVDL